MGLPLASPPSHKESSEKNGFFSGGEHLFVKEKNIHKTKVSKLCSRGHWTPAEDAKLTKFVANFGPQNWNLIAEKLEGRSGKSCRLRWFNQLDPRINKKAFTEEEEQMLLSAHKFYGNKWAVIARLFRWRTDNAVKNHWHVIMARRRREKADDFRLKKLSNLSCSTNSCISGSNFSSNKDDYVSAFTELSLRSTFTRDNFLPCNNLSLKENPIGSHDVKLVDGRTDHSGNSEPKFKSSLIESGNNHNVTNILLKKKKKKDDEKESKKSPFIDFLGVGSK